MNHPPRILPHGFRDALTAAGVPDVESLCAALASGDSPTSVRLNRTKGLVEGLPLGDAVPWCPGGYFLTDRPVFAHLPRWHAGLLYVQDSSSMALGAVVAEIVQRFYTDAPLTYLDACAAPGGKTIAAIEALPQGSMVVCNEFEPRRANILAENIAKWGAPGVVVTRGDTARLTAACPAMFDIIGADVPCSGEGMMRKDSQAIAQWSPGLIGRCAALQREILDNLRPTLRPGGVLIYSTCTFNPSEDEDNVRYMAETFGWEPLEIKALEQYPEILRGIGSYPSYRFHPGRVRGEGLFIAALRRPADDASERIRPKTGNKGKTRHATPVDSRLKASAEALVPRTLGPGYVPDIVGERLYAVPAEHLRTVHALADGGLDMLCRGIPVATVKGRDWQPCHELALSRALRPEAAPRAVLPDAEIIAYLRGEAVAMPDGTPTGYVLVCMADGVPVGWVKNLGRRANNLFPQHLRLHTDPKSV